MSRDKPVLVIGVVGDDPHIVGLRVLSIALKDAGFEVVGLGAFVEPRKFIDVAKETAADALLVSSLNGAGLEYARIFHDLVREEGMESLKLYMGGNIVLGKQPWPEQLQAFQDLGFTRVYQPGVHPATVIADLRGDFGLPATR